MLISIADKLSPQKFNKAGSDNYKYIMTGWIFDEVDLTSLYSTARKVTFGQII